MEVVATSLPEVKVIKPKVYGNARGFFFESYNAKLFAEEADITAAFVQDNHSRSVQNVLRGLHYQIRQPQGKLVRVVVGAVYDVAVDMRQSSPTCGQWVAVQLTAESHEMVWIPPGFAHGFLALTPVVELLYKTTDFYDAASEHCLRWNDPTLAIPWPLHDAPILSAKDSQGKLLKEAVFFP